MMKRVLAFLPALALLSALLPLVARADDPAALLAKHKAFIGWEFGDPGVRTLRAKRITTENGKVVAIGDEARIGLVYRHNIVYADGSGESNGFTGHIFWATGENGFTTPVTGPSQAFRLAIAGLLAEGTTQLPATSGGTGIVAGKTYPIVHVTMRDASDMNLYVDPDTGAYVEVVVDPGGQYETTVDNIAYTTVAGKKFLSTMRYAESNQTLAFSDITPNANVTGDDLHPPAPTATWAFANDNPFKIKVTQKRIYFDATINGVAGRFILDTGADSILLTREFEARIGVSAFSHTKSFGIGGEGATNTDLLRVKSLEVGGNTLSNVIVAASKARFDDIDDEEKPDGIIGYPLLGGAVVEVNTLDQTMAIHDPQTSLDAYKGVAVIADLSSGQPVVPMKMNKSIDVNATLDTGDTFYVLFPDTLITHQGLRFLVDNSALASNMEMAGVSGDEIDKCGNIESLALGPIIYSPAPGCTSNTFHGRDVLVGFDFLKNFNFVFAYPQGKIIMTPHPQ